MPGILALRSGQLGPQLRGPGPPRGQHEFRIGRTVVLTQRTGQIPGVQVPFPAGQAGHRAHGDLGVAVLVMRQVPGQWQPPPIRAGGLGERRDVLWPGHVGQRSQFGGILPCELAGQRVRGWPGRHQPGQPARRGVIEIFVVIVGHAPQVTRQVNRPPLRARRGGKPRRSGELSGQLADDRHPVAVGG